MSISQACTGKNYVIQVPILLLCMFNYLVITSYNKGIGTCVTSYRFCYHHKLLALVRYRYRYQELVHTSTNYQGFLWNSA